MNAPDRQLMQLLTSFAGTMVSDFTAEDALDRLVGEASEILGVDGCGIMLEDDIGELRFVAASDATVKLIEQYQVDTGEGPCVMAYETGRHVQVPTSRTIRRSPTSPRPPWPRGCRPSTASR